LVGLYDVALLVDELHNLPGTLNFPDHTLEHGVVFKHRERSQELLVLAMLSFPVGEREDELLSRSLRPFVD
jgi:hypothetical protein